MWLALGGDASFVVGVIPVRVVTVRVVTQGPNVTQPPMAFIPSQAPESDTNYFDYSALEFLATNPS
jgi:hypothetical protein